MEQGGVHYVKRNALAGRAFRDVHAGNRHLRRWCVETAGRRIHGTTKRAPLEVFDTLERAALRPLPLTPGELVEWKRAKLHADCHVVFGGVYYSAPHRLLGERLWVRATLGKVELFHDCTLVATHRPARPGQRRTLTAHLPPDQVHFLLQTPAWCRTQAAEIGGACAHFIDAALLGDRPLDRLRGAQGVLRLAQRYGASRLDAACARAHAVGEYRYHTVKTILVHALDQQPLPDLLPSGAAPGRPPPRHARPGPPSSPPRCRRQEVQRMELIHQLTPKLRTLRLSGILETLDVRNRQAVEQQSSFVDFLATLLRDDVERRAQRKLRLRLRRAAFDPSKTLESSTSASIPSSTRPRSSTSPPASSSPATSQSSCTARPASTRATWRKLSPTKPAGAAMRSSSSAPTKCSPISPAAAPTALMSSGWPATPGPRSSSSTILG